MRRPEVPRLRGNLGGSALSAAPLVVAPPDLVAAPAPATAPPIPAAPAPALPLELHQAGVLVAAAFVSLKSPLSKKKLLYSLSSGFSRDNLERNFSEVSSFCCGVCVCE
jgi:hypothetical protein